MLSPGGLECLNKDVSYVSDVSPKIPGNLGVQHSHTSLRCLLKYYSRKRLIRIVLNRLFSLFSHPRNNPLKSSSYCIVYLYIGLITGSWCGWLHSCGEARSEVVLWLVKYAVLCMQSHRREIKVLPQWKFIWKNILILLPSSTVLEDGPVTFLPWWPRSPLRAGLHVPVYWNG